MKKIILSLSTIVFAGAVVVGGTFAYFSDTEVSTGNVISSGALNLTLNGHNNATEAVVIIEDMKPSQTWYSGPITLGISNNPGRIYKKIVQPFNCSDVITTEPECDAEGGTWTDGGTPECVGNTPNSYLPAVTWFDLEIWDDENNDGVIDDTEWKILIADGEEMLSTISSQWIYMGSYGYPMMDNELVIRQSFHMDGDLADNKYQADTCTFNEEFMVLQTNAGHPVPVYIPSQNVTLDSINVGDSDSVSMQAHNAQLWFDDPATGGYGGRDGGETIAMIGGDDDGNGDCDVDESKATFEMDAGTETANKLVVRHLDGSANDSFDVYVGGVLVGNYVGGQTTGETWVTTTFDLGANTFTGKETITLDITTGYPWGSCSTYGQGAVNWVKITN